MNKQVVAWILFIVVIAVCFLGILTWKWKIFGVAQNVAVTQPSSVSSSTDSMQRLMLAGGEFSLEFSPAHYVLAVNNEPFMVHSYIPPCDENFDYCLYTSSGTYKGTNFESAGLRIKKRTDLATQGACLATAPSGFDSSFKPATTTSNSSYAASVFPNAGSAAAGHFAEDTLYRIFLEKSSSCYEFDTRIGTTDFENYPPGAINQFTDADQQSVLASLNSILKTLTLTSNQAPISLPNF